MKRLLIAFFLVIIYSVPAIAHIMDIPPLPSLNGVSNTIPFGSDKIYDVHYQQIFSSSIFTEPVFIEKLGFIPYQSGTYNADVKVSFAPTSVAVDSLSFNLDENYTEPLTEVFSDSSFSQVLNRFSRFGLVFDFSDNPFFYDSSRGDNLLLDIVISDKELISGSFSEVSVNRYRVLDPTLSSRAWRAEWYDGSIRERLEINGLLAQIEYTPVTPVPVDIKPGSCPNPLDISKKGNLPAAILGTDEFDVTSIDPSTVTITFNGNGSGGVFPLCWAYEDVATPFEPLTGKFDCDYDCTKEKKDGYLDLTLKFDAQEIISIIPDEYKNHKQCILLSVKGKLMDGTPFYGEDVISIRL